MGRPELQPRDIGTKKEISRTLKRLMAESGYTQSEASKLSGVAKSTLGDYIRGEVLPSRKNVEKLARLFRVSLSEIDPRYNDEIPSKKNFITPEEAIKNIRSADGKGIDPAEYDKVLQVLSAFLTKEGVKNG